MVAKLSGTLCSVINYWTLSHIVRLKLDIRNKKIILMEEQTIGTFWVEVQFLFFSRSLYFKNPSKKKKKKGP